MSLDNVTQDQRLLLEKIDTYSAPNRRTDRLAECMKQFGPRWDNSHTAFVGLQLRALGWVTTFKDASQYAQWNITPLGKALLCELRNVKQQPITESKVVSASAPLGWKVVGPEGEVSKLLKTYTAAMEQAEEWAKDEPGACFEIVAVHTRVAAKVIVEKLQ